MYYRMLLFVFSLSYSSIPTELINTIISVESSETAYVQMITKTPHAGYTTSQFTDTQSLEYSYPYVGIQP